MKKLRPGWKLVRITLSRPLKQRWDIAAKRLSLSRSAVIRFAVATKLAALKGKEGGL